MSTDPNDTSRREVSTMTAIDNRRARTHRRTSVASGLVAALALVAAPLTLGAVPAAAAADPTEVVAWGSNTSGESTVPAGLTDVTAISAGQNHSLALQRDGTVVAWGANDAGQTDVPAGLSDVTAISAGRWHNLALRADGTVVAWGLNSEGQASVPDGLSDVVAVAAGGGESLALRSDGTVVAWGRSGPVGSTSPADLSHITAIAAGAAHSLALRANGMVVAWGEGGSDQSTVPRGLSGVTAIAAGATLSMALRWDGTVVGWGQNDYSGSFVPDGLAGVDDVVAISAGIGQHVALRANGTVIFGGNRSHPVAPAGLTGVIAIAAGGNHVLALRGGTGTQVTASFTMVEPIVCVRLDTTSLDLGPVPLGAARTLVDATTLSSCGGPVTVVAGTSSATTAGPPGVSWTPEVPPADGLCAAASPPLDVFAYALHAAGDTAPVYLSAEPTVLGALPAGGSRTDTHTLHTACEGSDGHGQTLGFTITFTATTA